LNPLGKKLQLKPGYRCKLLNAPAGYADRLQPLPEGAALDGGESHDFIQLFVRDSSELEELTAEAARSLKPDGLLWVCYPKGGAKAGTDLNRDVLWQLMSDRGLIGVTLVAIDETWSAMRFRPGG
jgi:hypothetical protein